MDAPEDTAGPIRVALSNDYEMALLGLAQMLAQYPEQVRIVEITTDPLLQHDPDIILFDTFGRLPENDVKLLRMVAENDAKVVVYSWDDYPEETARRFGAAGYLHKGLSAGDLVAAIVALHAGDRPPSVLTADDGAQPVRTWPGQHAGLSEREAEMMTFMVRGLANEDIARRAYLSVNTVKTYIRTAYRKIGVTNRAQAVAWGFRNGFGATDDTGV